MFDGQNSIVKSLCLMVEFPVFLASQTSRCPKTGLKPPSGSIVICVVGLDTWFTGSQIVFAT